MGWHKGEETMAEFSFFCNNDKIDKVSQILGKIRQQGGQWQSYGAGVNPLN